MRFCTRGIRKLLELLGAPAGMLASTPCITTHRLAVIVQRKEHRSVASIQLIIRGVDSVKTSYACQISLVSRHHWFLYKLSINPSTTLSVLDLYRREKSAHRKGSTHQWTANADQTPQKLAF